MLLYMTQVDSCKKGCWIGLCSDVKRVAESGQSLIKTNQLKRKFTLAS